MFVSLRLLYLVLLLGIFTLGGAVPVSAQKTAPRYGMALLAGQAYQPERFGLLILQGNVQLPYDQVFWHGAPDSLFFQGEINLGVTTDGRDRALVAINMMAVKYLEAWSSGSWVPYLEGGIGIIYTDFKARGQGLRFNFNPQIGAGVEWPTPCGRTLSIGLRLHHLSNANLHRDNRGVDSVLMLAGVRF